MEKLREVQVATNHAVAEVFWDKLTMDGIVGETGERVAKLNPYTQLMAEETMSDYVMVSRMAIHRFGERISNG